MTRRLKAAERKRLREIMAVHTSGQGGAKSWKRRYSEDVGFLLGLMGGDGRFPDRP